MTYALVYRDPEAVGTDHEYHWAQSDISILDAFNLLEASCKLPEKFSLKRIDPGTPNLRLIVAD